MKGGPPQINPGGRQRWRFWYRGHQITALIHCVDQLSCGEWRAFGRDMSLTQRDLSVYDWSEIQELRAEEIP